MSRRLPIGATNQRIVELHNIKLFGNSCQIKNPAHNTKRRTFIPITIFFKLIFVSFPYVSYFLSPPVEHFTNSLASKCS